jgi:5-methylcytosine-specific restriction endonuclease McrA
MAVTPKVRFEVFKRDNFTCRYCGRKTPEVVLEVDHVVPVAEDGILWNWVRDRRADGLEDDGTDTRRL